MKSRGKHFNFKEWEDKFKKIKLKEDKLFFLSLILAGILAMSFLGFYFKSAFEKERLAFRRDLEIILLESRSDNMVLQEGYELRSPENIFRVRKEGIERFFLSEVELIGNSYAPIIHLCLFEEGKPIYPSYIYETQSLDRYPEEPPYQIMLMRYLLLPEDNSDFQPDRSCYIKEIKTEKDWQELEEKYGFSKSRFPTMPRN